MKKIKKLMVIPAVILFLFIMISNTKAIDVTSCQILNQSNSIYYLLNDITVQSNYGMCISFEASNITLDCQGHAILGNSSVTYSSGVQFISSGTYSTLKNCNITGYGSPDLTAYGNAVYLWYADYDNIINSTLNNNVRAVFGRYFHTNFTNCTMTGNSYYLGDVYLSYTENDYDGFFNSTIDTLNFDAGYHYQVIGNTIGTLIMRSGYTSSNTFYNNRFQGGMTIYGTNNWNTTKKLGQRIYGSGYYIGGNWYDSGSYSANCVDANWDGFCDTNRTFDSNNIDFFPLSDEFTTVQIISPTNTTYNKTYINLEVVPINNITPIDEWWYSINNGANTSFIPNATVTAIYGFNTLTVYNNDTNGTVFHQHVNFTTSNYINDCSELNGNGINYYITDDINNTRVSCIKITGNNSIVDCQRHNIYSYSSQYEGAITFWFSINSTLKNCFITNTGGHYNALVFNNAVNDTIANSQMNGETLFISSSNNLGYNNTFNEPSYGVYFENSNNNIFHDNIIYGEGQFQSGGNLFYNNLMNFTHGISDIWWNSIYQTMYWNTTRQTGTRIYWNGTEIGGNYWTNSSGNYYSDTCEDIDFDGFCDTPLDINTGSGRTNMDYLPLSKDYCITWNEILTNDSCYNDTHYERNHTYDCAGGEPLKNNYTYQPYDWVLNSTNKSIYNDEYYIINHTYEFESWLCSMNNYTFEPLSPPLSILVSAGSGIANFISSIKNPIITIILYLGIVGVALAIFFAIALIIQKAIEGEKDEIE